MKHKQANSPTLPVYAGVDVGKAQLDFGVCGSDGKPCAHWVSANTAAGIEAGFKKLSAYQPVLVVVEASGGFELAVVSSMAVGGLAVALVNPRQTRQFAGATGLQAKTDKIVHVCKNCGSEDAFCCVMKKGTGPTTGMEKK